MQDKANNKTKGGISVQTEHIFPIIKKWLYSEKEIFLREIVSNACDAVTKLRRLSSLGEVRDIDDNFKIIVRADKKKKTLTVSDNGIGMTEDEVSRYISQIALSGALDFIEKYEGSEENAAGNGIIGHFGLGFYSSFMVSDKVEVVTRSYTDAPAVRWVCSEDGSYEVTTNYNKATRGTDIIMHINDDEKEYLEESKLREILNKYCSFMPVEIYLETEEDKKADKEDGEDKTEDKEESHEPKPINDTHPLWQKLPSECTEEEYKNFYQKVFFDFKEPLFHIHINADYPLNFKGILYFPKLNTNFDNLEGHVKLYYNQVFVSDNIKEILPDYLLMLKGVIDCPELPLNVSRSYMQDNAYVKRMSNHIVKKVTDRLNGMFNTERENYEKLWNDMKIFVEFACLRDRKFYDKVKDSLLLPLTDGSYVTINDYLEKAKEKHDKVIYYTTDKVAQAQYISIFSKEDIQIVLLDSPIDTQFINVIEQDKSVNFKRVDSDLASALKSDGEDYSNEELVNLFKKIGGENLEIKFENLKDEKIPAILNISEESRRFEDMMKMYRMEGMDSFNSPSRSTLILNSNNSLIRKLGDNSDETTARQVYMLALISQRNLTAEELNTFLSTSYDILERNL